MNTPSLGLYEKFRVSRTDGGSEPGAKHEGCHYFVLDLDHDPFAYAAIMAYASKCNDAYPQLADDLHAKAREMAVWMSARTLDNMTPAERKRWEWFTYHNPERR